MKQLTFSGFGALCFLALHFSPAEPGQFQSRGHIVGQPRRLRSPHGLRTAQDIGGGTYTGRFVTYRVLAQQRKFF
jgi:hypothetical protein